MAALWFMWLCEIDHVMQRATPHAVRRGRQISVTHARIRIAYARFRAHTRVVATLLVPRCSFVFFAPLSRRCRCGRHAGMLRAVVQAGTAIDSASAARTPR